MGGESVLMAGTQDTTLRKEGLGVKEKASTFVYLWGQNAAGQNATQMVSGGDAEPSSFSAEMDDILQIAVASRILSFIWKIDQSPWT